MLDTPEFQPWGKTARLYSPVTITEKIDGTNGVIKFVGTDMYAGSRKRWISQSDDNYGFAKWAQNNYNDLLELFGPDSTTYGEWWGQGIQRGYNRGYRTFSPFWGNYDYLLSDGSFVESVPVLYKGVFQQDELQACITELMDMGSRVAPGFMQVEGVVVQFDHNRSRFKVVIDK